MYRTSVFLHRDHVKQLGTLAESRGLKTAQLIRIAIVEFLRRAAQESARDAALIAPTKAARRS